MSLGATIRRLRLARGMTLGQLAELTDSHVGNLSRMERGLERYTPERLSGIAQALGVKQADLFIDEPIEPVLSIGRVPLLPLALVSRIKNNRADFDMGEYPRVELYHTAPNKSLFAVKLSDDGMTAPGSMVSLPSGTLLIVDPNVTPESGRVVLAIDPRTGMPTCKRLLIDAGLYYLASANPALPLVPLPDPLSSIIGTVVEYQLSGTL